MMKKLLLPFIILFTLLFSLEISAQQTTASIDSIVITNNIDCYSEDADFIIYVDNDTNALPSPQCNPNCGPNIFYKIQAFKEIGGAIVGAFSVNNSNASQVDVNGLAEGTYYALVVDTPAFYSAFPFLYFNPNFGTQWSTVLSHPSVFDVDTITLFEPQELSNSLSTQTTNQCFGDCSASELISFSGGTLPYIIDGVSISGTDTLFDNLCGSQSGQTYTYIASDANGCAPSSSSPISFIITEPDPLTPAGSITSNFNGQDVSCLSLIHI